jgi:(p)ppGpp synthase/HD superfamily hydrolase
MTNPLSHRFEMALGFAFRLHKNQYRKQSRVPYISHLLGVTAIVLENGGTENQAIAALLHDAVEDQGGYDTLIKIKELYGEEVAEIVEGCTDAFTDPKPAWKKRKSAYLKKLISSNDAIQLVSLADKIHNARSILHDLKSNQENVWLKFNGGKEGTLWYYQSLVEVFNNSRYRELALEFQQLVTEISELSR